MDFNKAFLVLAIAVVSSCILSIKANTTNATMATTKISSTEAETTAAETTAAGTETPTATVKDSKKDRDTNIKGVGRLQFFRKGARMVLERKSQKLEIRINQIKVNGSKVQSIKNVEFDITKEGSSTTYDVESKELVVKGIWGSGTMASLSMYMFTANGTILGDDGYEYNVTAGSLKFNIKIDWAEGAKDLEVELASKCSKGTRRPKKIIGKRMKGPKGKRPPAAFSVCPTARITYSPGYTSGGVKNEMEEGYPKEEGLKDGWSIVNLKFNGKNVVYDPVAETGTEEIGYDDDDDGSSASQTQICTWLFTIMVFVTSARLIMHGM